MNVLNYDEIFAAVQVGVLGYVVFVVLMSPGHLLEGHKKRLEWWVCGGSYFSPPNRYTKILLRDKIAKPLGGCSICSTGQLSFWIYIFSNLDGVNPLKVFLFSATSILTIKLIEKWQSN